MIQCIRTANGGYIAVDVHGSLPTDEPEAAKVSHDERKDRQYGQREQ